MTQIFIISNHPMFGRGLESLLRQDNRLDVMGQEADLERAVERIKNLRPDVVIVDNSGPKQQAIPAAVLQILDENSGTKVVGMSLQGNHLSIYQATQRIISSVEDLINIIDNDLSPPENIPAIATGLT